MGLGMELRLRQHLAITPQLRQALRLLQLPSQEFAQEVEQAIITNPFLEEDPDRPAPAPAPSAAGPPVADVSPTPAYDGGRGGNDEDSDWTDWTESPVSLRENLRNQLLFSTMSDRDRTLAHLIIDELTDAGYLVTPLEELLDLIPPEDGVDLRELNAALAQVQQLEPVGIAARTLQECLLLQLRALPLDTPDLPLALQLVSTHLGLLAAREFNRLQQDLGCSEDALHSARTLIRSLEPRPGRSFAPDDTRYVAPDIFVTFQQGRWVATLNPAVRPQLRINRAYADLATGRHGGASFSGLLQEARWLLRNVEQRFNTIQRVADAIVARQRMFFKYGEAAMKPMGLKDIATELGLHESTVCRVTNGKYMATPRGLFEFKYFFSRQLATDDGGSCSGTAIRALMKELIAAENPQTPLSDARLTHLLAEEGLKLARRTVTKYRGLMRIPSVELRRVARRTP